MSSFQLPASSTVIHMEAVEGPSSSSTLMHLDADGRLIAASGIGPGNAVARDIRLAEMLIAARIHPDPAELAVPETKLKKLLGSDVAVGDGNPTRAGA